MPSAAAHVLAGRHHEFAWELFRFGHFKGLTHEDAAVALSAWARRQGIAVAFEVLRVRTANVVFVLMTTSAKS